MQGMIDKVSFSRAAKTAAMMALLMLSAGCYICPGHRRAREAVLKTNLQTMREAIKQYREDKAHYPDSLETLVEEGYLRDFPVDPITLSRNTWEFVYSDGGEDAALEGDLGGGGEGSGIFDVKSGSGMQALDGSYYSEW